jgi:hypothetical protein
MSEHNPVLIPFGSFHMNISALQKANDTKCIRGMVAKGFDGIRSVGIDV